MDPSKKPSVSICNKRITSPANIKSCYLSLRAGENFDNIIGSGFDDI